MVRVVDPTSRATSEGFIGTVNTAFDAAIKRTRTSIAVVKGDKNFSRFLLDAYGLIPMRLKAPTLYAVGQTLQRHIDIYCGVLRASAEGAQSCDKQET